jgi:hypothetical protein
VVQFDGLTLTPVVVSDTDGIGNRVRSRWGRRNGYISVSASTKIGPVVIGVTFVFVVVGNSV